MANKRGQLFIPTPLINAAAAGADATDYGVYGLPHGARILEIDGLPHAAGTADDTNFSTLTVSAGATAIAAVTTETTGSGNLVAGTAFSIPLTAGGASVELSEGEVISIAKTYDGTGLAIDLAGVLVTYELLS